MKKSVFCLIISTTILIACGRKEKIDTNVYIPLPETVKAPENNPTTKEKVELGKLLFFDPILSGDKDVACATCHHPTNGYAEFRDISIGVNGVGFGSSRTFKTPNSIPFVKRNAHTILNTAYNGITIAGTYNPENAPMFWDSRVNSLEQQALEPIKALEEMRGTNYTKNEILNIVVSRVKEISAYQELFKKAFPENSNIDSLSIAKAIAAFERSLVTNNSRFDKFLRGDETAISLSEKEGFELFKKVGCANCHSGPMFSDYKMHVLGVEENDKLDIADGGLNNEFLFRTPTLRNLGATAPYMHNGSLSSLLKVLEFYEDISSGRSKNKNVPDKALDSLVKKITIKVKDMSLINSFLNTLNDSNFDATIPDNVPSGLSVGGNIN